MGVGRSLRKVIWIKPFYRGDENAPILTRPKLVDGHVEPTKETA